MPRYSDIQISRRPGEEKVKPPEHATAPRPGKVGRGHPETSKEAAEEITPYAVSHRDQIVIILAAVYPKGLTCREVAAKTGRSPNQEATRMQELREAEPPEVALVEYVRAKPGEPADRWGRLKRPTTENNSGLVQRLNIAGVKVARVLGHPLTPEPRIRLARIGENHGNKKEATIRR